MSPETDISPSTGIGVELPGANLRTPPPSREEGAEPTWPPGPGEPRWARWAILGVLAGTALLYLWGLSRNGWANSYYSAAAQAAGESWKAWFFGSLDSQNAITVDKPPASLWLMGLSVRVLGLSSWSVLVPQALLGVASVGLLYATVRRWFGTWAALIGAVVLALTPVAVLMFRFNNPDALLVFLLVAAAWAMTHATEKASPRWIMLAGAFVGMAFLAKMMQAFLVLPGFVAMYAVAAQVDLRRRVAHLLAAFAAMVVSAGWWVAVVELWPADSRPYIGGSQANSVLELILGYNGFGRLTGNEVGSVVGGGGQAGSMWGETGWGRLFDSSYGGQISWLLPAAMAMIGVLLWVSRRAGRTDRTRSATIAWGGWLLVTAAVISFSQGIIHEYYTVALAPAIGALVGIGSLALWTFRRQKWARITAAAVVAGSAWWAWVLLGRSGDFASWLRPLVLGTGLALAALILAAEHLPERFASRAALTVAAGSLLVLLAGPTAYALQTAGSTQSGSIPTAGPAVSGGRGFVGRGGPGGGFGPNAQGGPNGQGGPSTQAGPNAPGGLGQRGTNPFGNGLGNGNPFGNGTGNGFGNVPGRGGGTGGRAGGGGGLLNASTPSAQVTAALLEDADSYTWVAAAVGANSAAGLQLATEKPVMAIGGFNGSDPAPTLSEFQSLVASGEIHWFIASGQRGFGNQLGGSDAASDIATWVSETFTATTIDGVTLYDLTGSSSTTSTTAGFDL